MLSFVHSWSLFFTYIIFIFIFKHPFIIMPLYIHSFISQENIVFLTLLFVSAGLEATNYNYSNYCDFSFIWIT